MSIRQEIPTEEIRELVKGYTKLRIEFRRQDLKGHWSTVTGNILMTPTELLGVSTWIQERAGGGQYACFVTDPAQPEREVIQAFGFKVEGGSRPFDDPALRREQQMQAQIAPGLPRTTDLQPQPTGMANPPDHYLAKLLAEHRQEMSQLRAEMKERDDKRNQELDRHRAQLDELRRERLEERTTFREQLAQTQAQRQIDLPALLTAIGAVMTPIVTMMVNSRSESAREQRERETRLWEGQNQVLAKLAERPQTSIMDQLTAIMPMVEKFVGPIIGQHDPEKQARLYRAMGSMMAGQTRLATDLLKWASENRGEEPPWLGVIKEIASGAERIAQTMIERDEPPTQLAAGAGQRVVYADDEGAAELPSHAAAILAPPREIAVDSSVDRTDPNAIVMALMRSPEFPPCFKNQKWGEVCFHIATEQERQLEAIAGTIVELLQEYVAANEIPTHLHPLLEDPEQIEPLFLAYIPIRSETFRKKLVAHFVAAMRPPVAQSSKPASAPSNGGKGPDMVEPPEEARVPGTDEPVTLHQ